MTNESKTFWDFHDEYVNILFIKLHRDLFHIFPLDLHNVLERNRLQK